MSSTVGPMEILWSVCEDWWQGLGEEPLDVVIAGNIIGRYGRLDKWLFLLSLRQAAICFGAKEFPDLPPMGKEVEDVRPWVDLVEKAMRTNLPGATAAQIVEALRSQSALDANFEYNLRSRAVSAAKWKSVNASFDNGRTLLSAVLVGQLALVIASEFDRTIGTEDTETLEALQEEVALLTPADAAECRNELIAIAKLIASRMQARYQWVA